ncbi:MAG: hypothetical protein Kow0080_29410 [Candidatus Promineifilaceae bacterium]
MADKIMTLHPQGKQGVHIDREKYEQVKKAMMTALQQHGEMTFTELGTAVIQQLADNFTGSIMWYYTTVKLDLEARNILRRTQARPQKIQLTVNKS